MKKIIPIYDENIQPFSRDKIRKDAFVEFQSYVSQKESFHQIDKPSLVAGKDINFSIFIHKGLIFEPVIEASEKSPVKITPKILDLAGDFVIRHSDMPLFKEYLDSLSKKLLLPKLSDSIL